MKVSTEEMVGLLLKKSEVEAAGVLLYSVPLIQYSSLPSLNVSVGWHESLFADCRLINHR